MLKPEDVIDKLKMNRDPCTVCSWPMWQYDIVLINRETERRSYICPLCGHTSERTQARVRLAG
jgi:hypothetical protein